MITIVTAMEFLLVTGQVIIIRSYHPDLHCSVFKGLAAGVYKALSAVIVGQLVAMTDCVWKRVSILNGLQRAESPGEIRARVGVMVSSSP